jgi:hypothetical protein
MMRKLTPRLAQKRRMRLELLTDILIQIIYSYISKPLVMTVLKSKTTDFTDFRK